jgi:ATP-binding cassette, subfamily B, bacterial
MSATDSRIGSRTDSPLGAVAAISRGVKTAPEFAVGIGRTITYAMVGAVGRITVPILIQQAIDRGFKHGQVNVGLISVLGLIGAAVVIATSLAQRAAVARLGYRSEDALYSLRVRLFEHIHRLSLAEHADERRGALVSRVTSDIETLSEFFRWGSVAWLLDGTLMVLVAGVMLAYDWVLALVAFVVAAPLMWVLRRVQGRLVRAYDAARTQNAAMLGAVSELVSGAATFRAYGATGEMSGRVRAAARRKADSQIRAGVIGAFLFPSGAVFSAITIASVIAVGVARGPASGLSAGALIGFIFLTYRFLEPIAEFTEILDQTQAAVAGFRRILSVLDIPAGPPDAVDPTPLPLIPLGIKLRAVDFAYRPRPGAEDLGELALNGVDVDIAAGERIAIVGATGSGKSTLALLVARLADPTSGAVLLGDVDLRDVANADLRRRLMMVPQEPFLFDDTIEANLAFGQPGVNQAGIEQAFADLGLADWLAALPNGLATEVGERGTQLSAGERQLVALARAYLARPDVLVLDEATSSVDPLTETRFARAMDRLSEGRTTIAIAHRLSTAARAERIIVMDHGVKVEDGSHAQLIANRGTYAGLFDAWLTATGASAAATSPSDGAVS